MPAVAPAAAPAAVASACSSTSVVAVTASPVLLPRLLRPGLLNRGSCANVSAAGECLCACASCPWCTLGPSIPEKLGSCVSSGTASRELEGRVGVSTAPSVVAERKT